MWTKTRVSEYVNELQLHTSILADTMLALRHVCLFTLLLGFLKSFYCKLKGKPLLAKKYKLPKYTGIQVLVYACSNVFYLSFATKLLLATQFVYS